MKTLYILTIYHETKETQAFYTSRELSLKAAYELLTRKKPVSVDCIVYDNNNEIVKKTRVY